MNYRPLNPDESKAFRESKNRGTDFPGWKELGGTVSIPDSSPAPKRKLLPANAPIRSVGRAVKRAVSNVGNAIGQTLAKPFDRYNKTITVVKKK